MSRRFEPLYNQLPSPCRMMRIFGAIVQPFLLARSSLNCGPEEGRDSRVAPPRGRFTDLPRQARISLFHSPIPDDARDASALSQFLPIIRDIALPIDGH